MPDPIPTTTTTTDASSSSVTTATTVKPGMSTTEFYVALACILLGQLPASGLFPTDSIEIKVAGLIFAALSSIVYIGGRAYVKGKAS